MRKREANYNNKKDLMCGRNRFIRKTKKKKGYEHNKEKKKWDYEDIEDKKERDYKNNKIRKWCKIKKKKELERLGEK